VAWLRLRPAGRDGRVAVLPSAGGHGTEATINRKLSAVPAFYQHSARNGVELGDLLRTWQPAGRRGTAWRPFLHHMGKGQPSALRAKPSASAAWCACGVSTMQDHSGDCQGDVRSSYGPSDQESTRRVIVVGERDRATGRASAP
jgi:hypothetical protein